jgi:taurine dioxygenase
MSTTNGDMQMKLDSMPLVVPTGRGLGAEIRGVDLRELGDDAFVAIHRAWLDNLVLLFRAQQLTDAELIAFSRRFGELY